MHSPDIAQALVTDRGLMALVVVITAGIAVGLAVFVIDVFDGLKKKERSHEDP